MKLLLILITWISWMTMQSYAFLPSSHVRSSVARYRNTSPMRMCLSMRGGDEYSSSDYDDDEAVSETEDSDAEESEVEEQDDAGDQEGESIGVQGNAVDTDEDADDAIEDIQEGEAASVGPVKITLKTSLCNNPLIDQFIEITASPSRTVHSLKQSVSRQFKSRPPIDVIVLRLNGQVLDDDTLVQDLVQDMDEEDEEEDEVEDEDDDGLPKLTIIVDMVPPVDPKFGVEMKEKLDSMTNEELLDAYVANLAALHQNSLDLMESVAGANTSIEAGEENEESQLEQVSTSKSSMYQKNLLMQQYALTLKDQLIASLSDNQKELLEKKDTPATAEDDYELDSYEGDVLLKESMKRRKRRGGATANVKRALQKNLNINWPDTIRNFLLFLFFGYFGGRNAMSRTIMLLGAPACFVIQARPVKIAIKQLFYTIGEPPGILLSLLPAPQQAIMSCNYGDALKSVYGDDIEKYNTLTNDNLDTDRAEEDTYAEDVEDDFFDDFENYDDDYDDDDDDE